MYLNKKSVIAGLKALGDFKVVREVKDSIASDVVLVERKGSAFLLSFNDEYDDSDLASNKSLESPFGVHLIRPLDGVYKKIPLIDKYKISNKLTTESKSIATVTYREIIESYFISALYYPMVEQLQEFKTTSGLLEEKAIKFIVLSLLTMCFEKNKQLNNALEDYAHDSESLNKKQME